MTDERRADVVEPEVSSETSSVPPSAPHRDPSVARRRPRALRIPDDEVGRPQSVAPDGGSGARPPAAAGDVVLTPTRIITISSGSNAAATSGSNAAATSGSNAAALVEANVAPPATVPNLPIDEEPPHGDGAKDSDQKLAPTVAPEEVEIRFEDDAPAPETPRMGLPSSADGERRSDPGEAPEIAAEDLVAVETPAPAASIPPFRAKVASQPPVPRPVKIAPPIPRTPLVIVPPHVGNMPAAQAEPVGARRKARLWWEELFNDDYLHAMERISDDQIAREVHFIEESLGVEEGGALLDLACGTGRHAVQLARRGYEVVGFDLSLAMLARAGEDAQEREAKLNFVQGDMRDMTFEEQFDGVYCWNTSFGYFEEDKNAQVIDRVHRALKGGGLFLLDVVNRDFLVRQSPSLAWFEGEGCICMDEMNVDFITSRMKVKRTMMLDDGRSQEIEYSMRIYSLHELGRVLHEHGFTVREVSGRVSTPGVFFGGDSPRSMILAEKR
jgi:SAM-dependent methyltransferase